MDPNISNLVDRTVTPLRCAPHQCRWAFLGTGVHVAPLASGPRTWDCLWPWRGWLFSTVAGAGLWGNRDARARGASSASRGYKNERTEHALSSF